MSKRILPLVLLALAAVSFSGCGGGGAAPVTIAGDFFPLQIGTTWVFNLQLSTQIGEEPLYSDGTMTRTLLGREDLSVDGQTVSAYVFEQVYDVPEKPDFETLLGATPLTRALDLLYSSDGGLQTVRLYYTVSGGDPQRITLVGLSEAGGPIQIVPRPRPFLFNPPYRGTMETATLCFTQMPPCPPLQTLSNMHSSGKLLNYGQTGGPLGILPTVVAITNFDADFTVGASAGSINGRMRVYFQDQVGLTATTAEPTDWSATITMAGGRAIVGSVLRLTSID